MKCVYYFNNKKFNSELELDEEIIRLRQISENVTDIVFSKYSEISEKNAAKIAEMHQKSEQFRKENQPKDTVTSEDVRNWRNNYYGTDEPIPENLKAYATVTNLMKGIEVYDPKTGKLHRLFPEFDTAQYWAHIKDKLLHIKSEDWINRPDPETGKIFITEEYAKLMFGDLANVRDISESELPYFQARMEQAWRGQSIIGDLTHALFRIIFQEFYDQIDLTARSYDGLVEKIHKFKPTHITDVEEAKYLTTSTHFNKAKNNNKGFDVCPDEKALIKSVLLQAVEIKKKIELSGKYKNPRLFCEVKITGDTTKEFNPLKVLGQIDLLVIDDNGNVDIFDFKCSPKRYSEFDSAKKRTFMYQLSIYRRLLQQMNLTTQKSIGINVIPVQFANFAYEDDGVNPETTGRVTFTGVELEKHGMKSVNIIKDLDQDDMINGVDENLNVIMPNTAPVQDDAQITSKVQEFMKKVFPDYADFRDHTDESKIDQRIKDMIERNGGIQTDPEIGNEVRLYLKNSKKVYKGTSEMDIFNQIKEEWTKASTAANDRAQRMHKILLEAQKGYSAFSFRSTGALRDDNHGSYQWAENILKKYASPEWETINETSTGFTPDVVKILLSHGVVLVRNKHSGVIDVIKCSGDDLKAINYLNSPNGKSRFILGTFLSDDQQINNYDSMALEAINGNIELMETMAILNLIPESIRRSNSFIGEIKVMNTQGGNYIEGISASNEQLLYNFRRLYTLGGFGQSNFASSAGVTKKGNIQFCNYADLAQRELLNIKMKKAESEDFYLGLDDEILGLEDSIKQSILNNHNTEKQLLQLNELKEKLEEKYPYLKGKVTTEIDYHQHPEALVYNNTLQAIAELSGVQIVQQIKNYPKYFENISTILQQGLNGSYTDNPGTLKSQNLNKMASITERGYQNVRAAVTKFNNELQKQLREFKEASNFNWASKVTVGNQASLYKNLYDEEAKKHGMFQFKSLNDPRLLPHEHKLLNFAVRKLALDRYGDKVMEDNKFSEEKFMELYNANPSEVLQVPLVRATFGSTVASSGGLINAIKTVFKNLLPKNIHKYLSKKAYEFLDDTQTTNKNQKSQAKNGELFEMINRIKNSYNPELRDRLLIDKDSDSEKLHHNIDQYEINIERLLLSSNMALNLEKEINKIFPSLKAITVALSMQGIIQNTNFDKDLQFASDYIKNKIHGLPLEDLESFGVARLLGTELMSTASKLALAFNPLSMYQIIDGIWKDILLIRQKPDVDIPDDSAFTKKNMTDSFFWIAKEAFTNWGDKPTLGEGINRLYGINDMDINVFQDRINTDNAGIYNFWSLGFRFVSRPDYYNRMTIFSAQMRKDGSFEAHSVNEDGDLIYDWTKDKRFDKFVKGDMSNLELYNKQKGLYISMMKEFISEGVLDENGEPLKLDLNNPVALPRAYTTKQAESMKALGDKIYGYYSHEKRSMIQSYTLGALFMQMHTYWSSKKNQYLAGHGFTQQGNFEQYSQLQADGTRKKFFLDEDGHPTETDTGVPYMVWRGRPQEGIVVTLAHLANDLFKGQRDQEGNVLKDENGNELKGWSYMFDKNFGEHADAKLKALYRANMTQLGYDLFMFLLMGCIVAPSLLKATQKYTKEKGNANLNQAIINTSLLSLVKMFKTSTEDFNMVKSIFGQVVDWDPFSLSMLKRVAQTSNDLLFSDKDSYDLLIKIPSATRNTLPIFDFLKIHATGRRIGEHLKDED